jgi:hypothetical protein
MIVENTTTGKRERAYLMPVLWVGTKDAFTIGPGEAELEWRLVEATDEERARLEAVGLVFAKDPVVPAPSSLSLVGAYQAFALGGLRRPSLETPCEPKRRPSQRDRSPRLGQARR